MNRRVLDIPQRSAEWFAARCGKLTGSAACDMLATIKTGEAAARRDLRMRLALERLTGMSQDGNGYVNADMQRGIDLEPVALAAYEAISGRLVETTGFVELSEFPAGCSPDGYLGDFEIVVSIKCPKSATHLGYLKDGGMPSAYVPQMLHEMWVTGAKFYSFLSFDDRFPPGLRTFHVTVERDEKRVEEYAEKAKAFMLEVDREIESVSRLAEVASAV